MDKDAQFTTDAYCQTPETTRRRQLEFGVLREAAAPSWYHQEMLTRLAALLDSHVLAQGIGRVSVAPVDVVLDEARALVVQPDLVFLSTARLSLVRTQVWGAPDLVVEILSPSTAAHDRSVKLDWYRDYGVREVWIADPSEDRIDVFTFGPAGTTRRTALGKELVRSTVLPALRLAPSDVKA